MRSQLRRYNRLGDVNAAPDGTVVNGRLAYDPATRVLTADGETVKLTTSRRVLWICLCQSGPVFPAEEIYRRVWGRRPGPPRTR